MAKPKQILTEREKELVIALYEIGKTDDQVATVLGLKRITWLKVKGYNGLSNTIKGSADDRVEKSLYQRAIGYTVTEVSTTVGGPADGKVVSTVKHIAPDVGAQIMWLCNRRPVDWKNTQRVEHNIDAKSVADLIRKAKAK